MNSFKSSQEFFQIYEEGKLWILHPKICIYLKVFFFEFNAPLAAPHPERIDRFTDSPALPAASVSGAAAVATGRSGGECHRPGNPGNLQKPEATESWLENDHHCTVLSGGQLPSRKLTASSPPKIGLPNGLDCLFQPSWLSGVKSLTASFRLCVLSKCVFRWNMVFHRLGFRLSRWRCVVVWESQKWAPWKRHVFFWKEALLKRPMLLIFVASTFLWQWYCEFWRTFPENMFLRHESQSSWIWIL